MTSEWKLTPLRDFPAPSGPVVLVIMDGVGIGHGDASDAVAAARTPHLDRLRQQGIYTRIRAHGTAVGMPSDDDMGNSEVGHNALGAGRIFAQGASRVQDAIADGSIFRSETWNWLVGPCVQEDRAFHLIGLLSDGNVHSHIDHVFALVREAYRVGVRRLNVHTLLDGRDVPQTSAHMYLEQIEAVLSEFNARPGVCFQIASGGGRMKVTMDRYGADWAMVQRGWDAHVRGRGRQFPSALTALRTFREESPGISDQNLPAFVIARDGRPVGPIESGDSVLFFNFRGDRAIEMTQCFDQEDLPHVDRMPRPQVRYAGMMQYDGDLGLPRRYLVEPPAIDRTLGEFLARNEIPQCALSETQKFGHVTYFWNGNRSGMFDGRWETYREVPSDRLPFEERPWMKAAEITDAAVAEIRSGHSRFIRLNFANGDMVGHTGVFEATTLAVEAVDLCVGRLLQEVVEAKGVLVVTADHGNADEMILRDAKSGALQKDGQGNYLPRTSHSLNPVPCTIYDPVRRERLSLRHLEQPAGLGNMAATLLNLLGYEAPADYLPGLLDLR